MRYRISEIKLDIRQSQEELPTAVRKKIKKKDLDIHDLKIIKESVDARKKPDIKKVYTLEFSCNQKLPLKEAAERRYQMPVADGSGKDRPVVVGFGPAGMFAGLILAEMGLKPVILERGEPVEQRIKTVQKFWKDGILDPESNVQFGEGGAGTFSDGKLTTGIKDIRIGKVLEEFVEAGADPSILYKQKPHIGTDKLQGIVKNIRRKIEMLGGEIRFGNRLEDIKLSGENKAGERTLQQVEKVIVQKRKAQNCTNCQHPVWSWRRVTARVTPSRCCGIMKLLWSRSRFLSACGSSIYRKSSMKRSMEMEALRISWGLRNTSFITSVKTAEVCIPSACARAVRSSIPARNLKLPSPMV